MRVLRVIQGRRTRATARRAARSGDWRSAAEAYRRLVVKGVATAGDNVQLAHAYKEAGDIDAAIEAYRAAAASFPRDFDAQLHLGLFLRRVDRTVEGTNRLVRALALDPGDAFLTAELADIGIEGEALDAASVPGLLAGHDAVRPRPFLRARLLSGWRLREARNQARARRWNEAAKRYRAMLAADPGDLQLLVQLGHALREDGDAEGAVAAYRSALAGQPRSPDIYVHLGHALKALGRSTAALQAYLAAWRLQPGLEAAAVELQAAGWDEAALWKLVYRSWSAAGPDVEYARAPAHLTIPYGASLTRHERSIWMLLAARGANRA